MKGGKGRKKVKKNEDQRGVFKKWQAHVACLNKGVFNNTKKCMSSQAKT